MVAIDDVFDSHDGLVEAARGIHPGVLGAGGAADLSGHLVAPRPPLVIDERTTGLLDGPLVGLSTGTRLHAD